MNQFYIELTEVLDFRKIKFVLEEAKNLKTDILLIPQFIFQASIYSSILGISDNAIITIGDFDRLRDESFNKEGLWRDTSLKYISLWTKDISPFMKLINDTAESKVREVLNITNPKEKVKKDKIEEFLPKSILLTYRKFIVNNIEISIGTKLTILDENNKILSVTLGNNTVVTSEINLINYQQNLGHILEYSNMWNSGHKVCENVDISDDFEFNDIINVKTTEGARMWIPKDNNLKQYMVYLNKAFINISKGEKIYLSIVDNIPNKQYNYFLVNFFIDKAKKKKCRLQTLFAAIKLLK